MPRKTKPSKKPAPGANRINKSAWVRGLPKSMSAEEVVAKGQAAGVVLSTAQVYTIRSNAKHAKKPTAATQKPAVKAAPAVVVVASAPSWSKTQIKQGTQVNQVNKAALVRSFPTTLPIKEVIAKAKIQGVRLTAKYVHGARAKAKARQDKAAAKGVRPQAAASPISSKAKAPSPVRAIAGGDLAEQFVNLALDVGLVRSASLLASLRAAAKQLTGA